MSRRAENKEAERTADRTMTEDSIKCPRCQGRVRSEKQGMGVAGKTLDIVKFTCVDCETGFFFEESIVTFLVLKSVNKSE